MNPQQKYYASLLNSIHEFLNIRGLTVNPTIHNPESFPKLHLWAGDDLIFHRPSNLITIENIDPDEEYSGIQIEFCSQQPPDDKLFKVARELMTRLMFHDFPILNSDYGKYTPFTEDATDNTCWHHCSLSWVTDSNGIWYTIQVGYCHCS